MPKASPILRACHHCTMQSLCDGGWCNYMLQHHPVRLSSGTAREYTFPCMASLGCQVQAREVKDPVLRLAAEQAAGTRRSPGMRLSDVAEGMEEDPNTNWDAVPGQLDDLLPEDPGLTDTDEPGEQRRSPSTRKATSLLPCQAMAPCSCTALGLRPGSPHSPARHR